MPLSAISAALGLLNSGTVTSSATQSCTQNPTQSDATTVNTNSPTTTTTPTDPNMGGGNWGGGDHHSGWKDNDPMNSSNAPATDGTSGFNGDSVLNLSNNQVPVQACNNDIPVNVLGVQVPVTGASGALGLLNSGTVGSSADRTCTQTPTQTNPTTVSTNS